MKKTKKSFKTVSKTTATSDIALTMDAGGYVVEVPIGTPGSIVPEVLEVKVNKLDIGFPSEDLNKVVAKLNEVI